MTRLSNKDYAALIARLFFGGLMLSHGWPKLMKVIAGDWTFADPLQIGVELSLGLTVFAEVFCSIALIIGWKMRWFVIPLIITMIVAAFIVHGPDPLSKKEPALLFLGGYIVLALLGPGKISLDRG
jgi:putative oxidoreductase